MKNMTYGSRLAELKPGLCPRKTRKDAKTFPHFLSRFFACFAGLLSAASLFAAEAEIKDPAISGGVVDGKMRIVIEGLLNGQPGDKDKLIFATRIRTPSRSRARKSRTTLG